MDGHTHTPPTVVALRQRGRRVTAQRAAVWRTLTTTPDLHLSAQDVTERVRREMPHVNQSTVYRTLETLVAEGLVRLTDVGAGRALFEPSHEHRHHHLVCETCGMLTHAHDDVLDGLAARLTETHGFALGSREITISGRCHSCQDD